MKRTNRELYQLLDNALAEVRQEQLNNETVKTAVDRIWQRIASEEATMRVGIAPVERIRGCEDFQSLIPTYLRGDLTSARVLLLEDHTRECVPCRKALKDARRSEVQKVQSNPAIKPHFQSPALRWAIAAVLVLGIGLVVWPWAQQFIRPTGSLQTIVQAANGNVYRVSESQTQTASAGGMLGQGERIRTAKNASAVIKLADGSLVEMSERAELSVKENAQGATINLERGQIVVEAAKQRDRHLYVTTNDGIVSVTGTIFSVNRGTKGSRVSVIEGEVHVDHSGKRSVLRPGDQLTTHASIERIPVKQEVAWSQQSQKYAKILDDLAVLRKEIDAQVARPGVRYSTRLLDLTPEGVALYVAIPNLSQMLADANRILAERIEQDPNLREWWEKKQLAKSGFGSVIERVRQFGSYLGPEIVLCAELGPEGEPNEPLMLAELTDRSGFDAYLKEQLAMLRSDNKSEKHRVRLITDVIALPVKTNGDEFFIWVKDDLIAASPSAEVIAHLANQLKMSESKRSTPSAFHAQIAELYQDGAGLVIAADLQRILATSMREDATASQLGLLNVKYFIAELKEKDGRPSNRAMLSFTERRGVTSWLAAPGPMGALEFISPDATVVTAFVVERPVSLVNDLLGALKTASPEAWQQLKDFEAQHGFDLSNDFATPLGGEFAFAVDGPVLPIPAWKTVIEVNDQAHLQQSFERTVAQLNEWAATQGKQGFSWQRDQREDSIYYTLKSLDFGVEAVYTFAYGYLIAAPSRTLVERAIRYHDSNISLLQAPKFRATLPDDRQANFSAMFYYNFSQVAAPLAKQGVPMPKSPSTALSSIAFGKPVLAYVYALNDRFTISANTEDGPIGLTPSMLLDLGGPFGLRQIIE